MILMNLNRDSGLRSWIRVTPRVTPHRPAPARLIKNDLSNIIHRRLYASRPSSNTDLPVTTTTTTTTAANTEGIKDDAIDPLLSNILLSQGRSIESFHSDFYHGLLLGKVEAHILARYLELEVNLLVRPVWGIRGFRERLLADPSFPAKVGIECGIGVITKVTAEITKRQDLFWSQVDFVIADVIMALIADFMLTWLPAPTLSFTEKATSKNPVQRFFSQCPDNAFQIVQPGMPHFTREQRVGAIVKTGAKLMGVGFCASMLGVGITNTLCTLRESVDPTWVTPNALQDPIVVSLAYGVYMATSSNLRYQFVAGIVEERGIETFFKGRPEICTALSFITRTSNTFIGSMLWIDFLRLLGMQSGASPH